MKGLRAMLRATMYLDTSVFSAYWYAGANSELLTRKNTTREWWDIERQHFELLSSAFVETELRHGVFRRQDECLRMCRRQNYVVIHRKASVFQHELLREKIIPENKPVDAWHLSLAVTYPCDYLLTWNYSHLANPDVQMRLSDLCERLEMPVPWLVSPETVPQVRFGRVVRRRNRDV